MNTIRLIPLVLILLSGLLQACASIPRNKGEEGFPIHGNFCGPNVPTVPEYKTKEEKVAGLKKIKPIDDIDKACQAHDICYIKHGYFNTDCDEYLIEELDHFMYSHSCANLAFAIGVYFRISPKIDNGGIAKTLVGNLTSLVMAPLGGVFGAAQLVPAYMRGEEYAPANRWDRCNQQGENLIHIAMKCYPTNEFTIPKVEGSMVYDRRGLVFFDGCWRRDRDPLKRCIAFCPKHQIRRIE